MGTMFVFGSVHISDGYMIAGLIFCAALLARVWAASAYRLRWALFRRSYRRLENKADVEFLHENVFGRLAREYAARGERSPERLDGAAAMEIDALRTRALFWNAATVARWADWLDLALVLMGFALAAQEGGGFAVACGLGFIALKTIGGFFDAGVARARYIRLGADALEMSVGRFYAARTGAGELKRAGEHIAEILDQSARASSEMFAGGVKEAANEMGGMMTEHAHATAKAASDMAALAGALREATLHLAARSEAFENQNKLTQTNQAALEAAVQQYEVALQNVTSQMGEAFGKMAEYQIRAAYERVNGNDETPLA